MAHAIVVLARVTPWAPRAELFGKIPIFFVILVGFGACLFCCCKVPGMYRSCRDTYNEGDDVEKDEDEDEDGEKRVSRHRPGRERQKQRGGKRERQKRGSSEEKEAWWHKSASQLSQHFGGENPMAAQRMKRKAKAKPKPAPPPPPESLPEGWEEFFDDDAQRPYFHNAETGETVWERPDEGAEIV